jgi:hypothetical protein
MRGELDGAVLSRWLTLVGLAVSAGAVAANSDRVEKRGAAIRVPGLDWTRASKLLRTRSKTLLTVLATQMQGTSRETVREPLPEPTSPKVSPEQRERGSTIDRILAITFIAFGVLALSSYTALAFVHLFTLYDINQTSGAWLSFAYYLDHGTFYPRPYEHGWYAGTRYMPLFFAFHALLAQVTGEYLASGKLATLVSTIAIVVALALILRPRVRSLPLSIALAASPLATFIGHKGSLTIRSDVLPLALSLFALYLVDEKTRSEGAPISWKRLLSAALLAGLAPLAKFTSFHALTAGFIALSFKDKRRAMLFGLVGFAVFLSGVLATEALSNGGLSANFSATALGPGENKRGLGFAIETYAWYVRSDRVFAVMLGFAFVSFVRSWWRPWRLRLDLYKIYFLLHAVISLGFFFDVGAEYNHLIDLVAAAVIVCADGLEPEAPRPIRRAVLVGFTLALAFGLWVHHAAAWRAPERGQDARRWLEDGLGLKGLRFLSQDPTVPVLLDQRPVLADDFQYRVLVEKGIVPDEELPERIRVREFDRIVLLNAPDSYDPLDPEFFARELGAKPARTIRREYELEKQVGRYYVYRPRELTR